MTDNINVNVYCIIEKNGKVLLTEDEGKKGWKFSGGAIEEGEKLFETAKREVKEETGFDIKLKGIISIQDYFRENKVHRLRFYFLAELIGGKEKLMKGEVKRIKWFSRKELEKLNKKDFFIEKYYLVTQEYLNNKIYPIEIIKQLTV